MQGGEPDSPILCFGVFELDLGSEELRKEGSLLRLPPQPLKVLALLARRAGQLVTREEIQKEIWGGDTFVDFEHGLNFCINRIREALGDNAETPRFIQTLPRRGYRFIAPVETAARAVSQNETLRRDVSAGTTVTAVGAIPELPQRKRWRVVLGGGALAVLAAILIALNSVGLRDRLFGGPSTTPIRSIAVLPLENLSGDVSQEYFADGMTDELITDLAKIGSLRVISRTSSMRYKRTQKPLSQIAHELNVDAVVEGTVVRSGDKVRITAQLIQAPTDRHLWADRYERELRDIVAAQNEVARDIAEHVRGKLTPQEEVRLARARSVSPEAYDDYLRGRFYWSKFP